MAGAFRPAYAERRGTGSTSARGRVPRVHRLQICGDVTSEMAPSENNRRGSVYKRGGWPPTVGGPDDDVGTVPLSIRAILQAGNRASHMKVLLWSQRIAS